ncbi:MAG TPA: hypothetical protein VLD67_05495 [Vicinamibacterales bacterium]|nr:hypothetical protein [Vicinamibacterales bacterium]
MRTRVAALVVLCMLAAGSASAQYTFGGSGRATGENYHVELSGFFWNPTPELFVTSESLQIIGSRIDFNEDLGIETKRMTQMRVVGRPATRHKFRFEYTPIKYSSRSILNRDITFAGTRFPVSVPVESQLTWRAYRFGYEYDFLYRDRFFVGLLLDVKYTDVEASIASTNLPLSESVRARAPIPAIGVVGRGYVTSNISITGEFSAFKWPDSIDEDYSGRYYDFDIYGTVNFTDNFGFQAGYRSLQVFYKVEGDEGDFSIKGLYFGGIVRF